MTETTKKKAAPKKTAAKAAPKASAKTAEKKTKTASPKAPRFLVGKKLKQPNSPREPRR